MSAARARSRAVYDICRIASISGIVLIRVMSICSTGVESNSAFFSHSHSSDLSRRPCTEIRPPHALFERGDGLRAPRPSQLAHIGLSEILILRADSKGISMYRICGSRSSAAKTASASSSNVPRRSGRAVEDTTGPAGFPEPEQVVDAVLHEDEVSPLSAIGIGRIVRLEERNLAFFVDLATSMPNDTRHAPLVAFFAGRTR